MNLHIDAHSSALNDYRLLKKVVELMAEKFGAAELKESFEILVKNTERKQENTNENN